ncbi:MAG TPA: VWA domain-containing protein [Thermoanaerobaculia bacterium]|nr:VWA domain-containing protein [Thermoanaerobaculia bacterium]
MADEHIREALVSRIRVWTLCVVFVLCCTASAQEPRAGESIEVSIVNVEVHVTDKQGNRVTGLRAEDFEIRENGKAQPITNFSEYESAGSAGTAAVEAAPGSATGAEEAPPRLRRSIVIFIEPVTLANFRTKELFDSIRTLLRRTVEKGDQVSIVTFVRATRVRQPFTDDMASIDAALAALEKEMSGVEGNTYDESKFVLEEAAYFEKEYEEALSQLGFGLPGGTAVSMDVLAAARRQRFLIRQKTAALEALVQSISGADGRKILVMATRRFGLYAGAEYFGGSVPPEYRQELDTAQYRQSLIATANANGVTIYPVHPEGLQNTSHNGPSVSGQYRMESTLDQDLSRASYDNTVLLNESAALEEVAVATGGASAWGSASIAKLLPRVGDDLESYYSLAYRATATGKDGARRIAVTTKNPAYVVRSRKQFVEKSETTQIKDRVRSNLFQRVEGSSAPIPFDVAVGTIKKTGRKRWAVPLKIRIPIANLTTLPRGPEESGTFSVFFATGGVLGVMSDVEQRSQQFTIPRGEIARAKSSHFTYDLELTIDQLVKSLSIAVMDDVGKEFGLKRYELPKTAKE